MTGAEAAEVFYQPGCLTRVGALPPSTLRPLQDTGSVATLDGEDHRHRKAMFMAMMTPDRIDALATTFASTRRETIPARLSAQQVVLRDAMSDVLTRSVFR